jgi:hypothetical protein
MASKFLRLVAGIITEIEGLVTSAGAGDAGKIPALDAAGRLSSTMLPVGVGVLVKSVVSSENLAARDMVNVYNDAGTLKVRKADANNAMPAHGYVTAAVTSPAAGDVYFDGIISGFTALTPGARMYLSETAGEVTETAPSTAASLVQYIGVALSATEVEFDPSDHVVLA